MLTAYYDNNNNFKQYDNDDSTEMNHANSPSELYEEYKKRPRVDDDATDHDGLLQNLLSLLSTTRDPTSSRLPWEEAQNWNWDRLTQQPSSSLDEDEDDDGDFDHSLRCPADREWSAGVRFVRGLLPHISSPFELHSVASQSILMMSAGGEELTPRHFCLCMLLCAHALRQCSVTPPTKRWRRWQSITCETIRLFQSRGSILAATAAEEPAASGGEEECAARLSHQGIVIDLWKKFVAPACLHVVQVLPPDAYHAALFAGLVGTTLSLAENVAVGGRVGREEPPLMRDLLSLHGVIQSICDSRPGGASSTVHYSESTVWRHPWRPANFMERNGNGENEDVIFWIHQDDLSWWTHRNNTAPSEERVAHMDTSWRGNEISLLAAVAFHESPLVYDPTYVWTIWFPHVAILLRASSSLEDWQLRFLQRLVEVTPEHSLSVGQHNLEKARPDSPLEVFQLLSNRMMVRQPTTMVAIEDEAHGRSLPPLKEQHIMEFRKRTERFVRLMKGLLSRYATACQVHIVQRLIRDCPNPGLQARFLDLLRPILFDPACREGLVALLMSVLDEHLWRYWDEARQEMVTVDELIQNVEMSVGALTMIQLWGMVGQGTLPLAFKGLQDTMTGLHETLRKQLDVWSTPSPTATQPPEEYHRLFLLDSSLHQVLEVINRCDNGSKDACPEI
jgi:hypothetical protein